MLHPLVTAIEQWHWGREPPAVALAANNLRLIDPDHWLLQELARKLVQMQGTNWPCATQIGASDDNAGRNHS